MAKRLLGKQRIRNRRFPGLSVEIYENTMMDGRRAYSSEINIAADDRIVVDGRTREELDEKTKSTLRIALYCRRAAAV